MATSWESALSRPALLLPDRCMKDRLAFTQSFEYRFVRTPVESLPPLKRDTKLESFDSFSQLDLKINDQQTATFSFSVFPREVRLSGAEYLHPAACHARPAPARSIKLPCSTVSLQTRAAC